jgi:hypothetical protein
LCCEWKDLIVENLPQYGPTISLEHTTDSNSELEILELMKANVDSRGKIVGKQEKRSRIRYRKVSENRGRTLVGDVCVPKRRLLSRAYAFFSAAVFHFGSLKLLARNLEVAPCSLFQLAIRQRPWSTVFFFNAR